MNWDDTFSVIHMRVIMKKWLDAGHYHRQRIDPV